MPVTADEPSEYDRLFYPYLFEGGQADEGEVLEHVRHSTLEKSREAGDLRLATLARSRQIIIQAGAAMARAFAGGGKLLAFGNGGSTTDAADLVNELMHPPVPDWTPLPALSLTADVAVVTAVGNDVGFENVFARQIIAYGRAGDIAFGLSTSGNSRNIIAAFEQARKQGLLTVGMAGYDGGNTARSEAVQYCIVTPGDHIPRIQEAQATAYHALLAVIQKALPAVHENGYTPQGRNKP